MYIATRTIQVVSLIWLPTKSYVTRSNVCQLSGVWILRSQGQNARDSCLHEKRHSKTCPLRLCVLYHSIFTVHCRNRNIVQTPLMTAVSLAPSALSALISFISSSASTQLGSSKRALTLNDVMVTSHALKSLHVTSANLTFSDWVLYVRDFQYRKKVTCGQWFCFSRCIGYVNPTIIFSYYKYYLKDQTIPRFL